MQYTRTRLGRGIEVVTQPGDFGTLCQEALEQARIAYPDNHFVYEGSGDLVAAFDGARMEHVLGNLLNNAVQHGHADSSISMEVSEDSSVISAVLMTQGVPIPAHALQSIFDCWCRWPGLQRRFE